VLFHVTFSKSIVRKHVSVKLRCSAFVNGRKKSTESRKYLCTSSLFKTIPICAMNENRSYCRETARRPILMFSVLLIKGQMCCHVVITHSRCLYHKTFSCFLCWTRMTLQWHCRSHRIKFPWCSRTGLIYMSADRIKKQIWTAAFGDATAICCASVFTYRPLPLASCNMWKLWGNRSQYRPP